MAGLPRPTVQVLVVPYGWYSRSALATILSMCGFVKNASDPDFQQYEREAVGYGRWVLR